MSTLIINPAAFWACVAYVVVVTAVAGWAIKRRQLSLVEPLSQFLIFNSLFTLPLAIRVVFTNKIEGNVSPFLLDFVDYIPISVVFSAIAVLMFTVGYYTRIPQTIAGYIPTIETRSARRSIIAAAIIAAISLAMIAALAGGPHQIGDLLLHGYGITKVMVNNALFAVGFGWLFVAVMFLFVAYAISGNKIVLAVAILALMADLALNVVIARRAEILYILACFGTFFLLKIYRFKARTIIAFVLVGFLALNLLGVTRGSGYNDFGDFVAKTSSKLQQRLINPGSSFFYTLTVGEFVAPFETLPQIVKSTSTDTSYKFGKTYLESPLFLVPRAIWADRPETIAHWYVRKYYGQEGSLEIGRQFFWLSEAYLNFGVFGVVFISLLFGAMWRTLYEWLKSSNFDPGAALIYALSVGFMFKAISGSMVSVLAALPKNSIGIAIIGLLIAGTTASIFNKPQEQ
ncbi:hypothetical protein PSQ19_11060 [Devosia algicola]|uniref:Oligosaccharide repeat unit polymerase n=1 Tax=Devosia algicola TaxID=3026418 RepID=A0ABY7YK73_9HYPH|nr:hypothetical protein [Devosia algicola]WDR01365.1 hypothetical protein PSQ19_11060 [Devosia algicola]